MGFRTQHLGGSAQSTVQAGEVASLDLVFPGLLMDP